jgi:hypothetical protein
MSGRSHLKNWILVQAQGGAALQAAGILKFEMHKISALRLLILGNLGILAHFRHFYWAQRLRIARLSEHQNMFYNKILGYNTSGLQPSSSP